ncbi:MAG: hypothetical protein K6E35_08495 [Bacteroidales bacterium]|nr:hypothetical protein [Bacteroidales bacterium]
MEFILQPSIYSTSGSATLMDLLEKAWIKNAAVQGGKGTFYILSGFSNFNGGVRFYNYIEQHILNGGACKVVLGGSTSQKLSSKQVVTKLLEIGCEVGVVNRKAIFHAKCYGYQTQDKKGLIVSSGNFTSKGVAQNMEASIVLIDDEIKMPFDWENMFHQIQSHRIEYYQATLDTKNPVWKLLFDEDKGRVEDSDDILSTMVITLSASDTARIMAAPGTKQALGTQYIWMSKDSLDFFPPLNLRNQRGTKNAYQALVSLNYIDLNRTEDVRVTFEADNNLDFRLGTSSLKYTKLASVGDMAALTRLGNNNYELRLFKKNTQQFSNLIPYAVNFIGNRGKRFGYLSNNDFYKLI